jgi:hypothetical protein
LLSLRKAVPAVVADVSVVGIGRIAAYDQIPLVGVKGIIAYAAMLQHLTAHGTFQFNVFRKVEI